MVEKSMFQKYKDGELSYYNYVKYCAANKGKTVHQWELDRVSHHPKVAQQKNILCSVFLGEDIAETVLSKVFEDVHRASHGTIGYDFICSKGYKIDVKSRCLHNCEWRFNINHNTLCDYFLCIGFDDRENLTPLHIWLIKSDTIIRNDIPINKKNVLSITNSPPIIQRWIQYEQLDKLTQVALLCKNMKDRL